MTYLIRKFSNRKILQCAVKLNQPMLIKSDILRENLDESIATQKMCVLIRSEAVHYNVSFKEKRIMGPLNLMLPLKPTLVQLILSFGLEEKGSRRFESIL